jgi:hypothetical protein
MTRLLLPLITVIDASSAQFREAAMSFTQQRPMKLKIA